ncbi:fused MFS/spermidine synthase [Candidatus Phycosocius spiralis]|uniref:Spermidine synthase n=1 Tax=Candidatus Phycosocius spiralis TaxID=2815099 RepID=A0ABQ4PSP3_9PROT|nr:fused MFS/spermidine synthase [Candidatus Phycosocius spiralis]GIU65975.1 hypothetical protein PsB1_0129 [Candidatus Phycosocius spiralis]
MTDIPKLNLSNKMDHLSATQLQPTPLEKAVSWLYPATTFLSAALLFTLQPLFAKMLTPLMGGTPAVWNTALVFYQCALLIGYLYAHILATRFTLKIQLWMHTGVLLIGLIFLPIKVSTLVGAPNITSPVLWTLSALIMSLAAPMIAISATAPLIQVWRARLGDHVDPYRLYGASNLGSFIALGFYPFVLEPMVGARLTSVLWSLGYCVLMIALIVAWMAVPKDSHNPNLQIVRPTTWLDRVKWAGCAAPPSALLVGVTTHLTTDVASVPLLWIPPLALFLLTFVIAFSPIGQRIVEGAAPLKFLVIFLLAAVMAADLDGGLAGLGIHLAAFFLIVLCCHLELAAKRPEPARLTEFYLWMSLGGVIGGASAALLAPMILKSTLEYQLALVATLAVAPWRRPRLTWTVSAGVLVVGVTLLYHFLPDLAVWLQSHVPITQAGVRSFAYSWYDALHIDNPEFLGAVLSAVLAIAAVMVSRFAPVVAAIGAIALMFPVLSEDQTGIRFRERSFFGVLQIRDNGVAPTGWRYLTHGTTLHGVMSLDPKRINEPLSYYWRETPIGTLLTEATAAKPETLRAGVIGMGMGSSTCYAKVGQSWTVFEIDPDVVKAATDPNLVGFINRCAPYTKIVMGDARIQMQQQPNDWFDILLVDAFSSDAIPTHLITKEAIASFMSKIAPDGIMIVHISNRYLELSDIVSDAAHSLGYAAMLGDRDGASDNPNADTAVRVVVIARRPERLARYGWPMWSLIVPRAQPQPWTDDHTDIIRALFAIHPKP